jgi:putative ABC transport system substrate-binding protein
MSFFALLSRRRTLVFGLVSGIAGALFFLVVRPVLRDKRAEPPGIPLVAVASYGPHASLEATLRGIQEAMAREGFSEDGKARRRVRFVIRDGSFDPALVPQMIQYLRTLNPAVMVVLTTPVAQAARALVRDVPVVYAAVTDPLQSGLIPAPGVPAGTMTGHSERLDTDALLACVRSLLPTVRTIGMLYATGESNDAAFLGMMETSARKAGLDILAVPVDHARDVPARMPRFKGKVDIIVVGTSGPVQPSLPAIVAEADRMGIPVLNTDSQAVRDGLVPVSFGVDYKMLGIRAGEKVAALLKGVPARALPPSDPAPDDHRTVIHKSLAARAGLCVPAGPEGLKAEIVGAP